MVYPEEDHHEDGEEDTHASPCCEVGSELKLGGWCSMGLLGFRVQGLGFWGLGFGALGF